MGALKPAALVALMLLVGALALGIGTTGVDLLAFLHPDAVVLSIRLPRVLLAALVGAALAASGVTLQAILQNPLADPYVVGVSGGAALGGVLALALGATDPFIVPLCAFAGAVACVLLLFALARSTGHGDPLTLLLAGTILNAIAGAGVTVLKVLVSANKAQEILFWLMGALTPEAPATLWAMGLYVVLGLVILLLGAGSLNLLALGEEQARALGLDATRARLLLFLTAALLVGAVVSVVGMIAFVGLVVPHLLRGWLGADHRRLLPASIFGGAIFLIVADAGARLSFLAWGTEVPVGAITACIGGPFFLFQLLHRR